MGHSVGWMATQIGFRHVEDQLAFANISEGEPELVTNERAQLLGLGRIQQRMKTIDQFLFSLFAPAVSRRFWLLSGSER